MSGSFDLMFSRFVHVAYVNTHSFLLLHNLQLLLYIIFCLFMYQLIGILYCFHLLAIMIMLLWTFMYMFYLDYGRIARSHSNSILKALRNYQTVFPNWLVYLHAHQNVWEDSIFSTSSSTHAVLHFYCIIIIFKILRVMHWYVIMASICISIVSSDIKQLVMGLLTIHISSLKKCPFRSFAQF